MIKKLMSFSPKMTFDFSEFLAILKTGGMHQKQYVH